MKRQPWSPADVNMVIMAAKILMEREVIAVSICGRKAPWTQIDRADFAAILHAYNLEPTFSRNGPYWEARVDHEGLQFFTLMEPAQLTVIGYRAPENTAAPDQAPVRVA